MNMNEIAKPLVKERDIGYDFIRFLAMMLIVIFHFYTTCRDMSFRFPAFLKMIIAPQGGISFGGVGVGLFFMLSGAVLIMTNKDLPALKFYKKRLIKIEIPQILGFIFAFWAMFIVNKQILHFDFIGMLISLFGLNYSRAIWQPLGINTIWVIGEWFTAVIIILYLIFPLLRKLFYKARTITTIIITVMFVLNMKYQILSAAGGWFSISNGIMYFWMGMLFNEYKSFINNKIIILNIILLLGLWIINPQSIFGFNYLPCFIFSVLLFTVLYKIKIKNKFTAYICKYNYEIYLVHHRIYILFLPALLTAHSNDLQVILAFLLLTGFVFCASEFLQKCSNIVSDWILNNKSVQNSTKAETA